MLRVIDVTKAQFETYKEQSGSISVIQSNPINKK